jgi:hypothetical protein
MLAEVFEEFKHLTTAQLMDVSGVSDARLRQTPLQWPCPASNHPGTPRLHTDWRFATSDGRARFVAVDHAGPVEGLSYDYSLF